MLTDRLVGRIGPLAAVAAEAMLVVAWWRLSRDGEAPGLFMAVWIWPLSWLACVAMGWGAQVWARRFDAPSLDGGKLAMSMILNLLAGTLVTGVPILVSLYAALMFVVAMSVTTS